MPERDLWAAVAETAILDAAKRINAARKGARVIHTGGIASAPIGPVECEIDAARRYFASPDWAEVCALAGINLDGNDALRIVTTPGWRPFRLFGDKHKGAA